MACGHIKMARAEWHRSDNMWLVEFSHEFEAVWSPNLHLKILTLFKEMKALRNALIASGELEYLVILYIPTPSFFKRLCLDILLFVF